MTIRKFYLTLVYFAGMYDEIQPEKIKMICQYAISGGSNSPYSSCLMAYFFPVQTHKISDWIPLFL